MRFLQANKVHESRVGAAQLWIALALWIAVGAQVASSQEQTGGFSY